MSSVLSGASIARVVEQVLKCVACVTLLMASGCGDSDKPAAQSGPALSDREMIQQSLDEVVARWREGDKAVLYDNEFEYLQDRMTFDEYLKAGQIQLNADTVKAMVVQDVERLSPDSVRVSVDVIFEGPAGIESRQRDRYKMFFYKGRWIRPTLSKWAEQQDYENALRAYDSAVEAEEDTGGN